MQDVVEWTNKQLAHLVPYIQWGMHGKWNIMVTIKHDQGAPIHKAHSRYGLTRVSRWL